MSNQSKVVFITGGSRGIGAACIEAFKEAGWKVAACSSRADRSESKKKPDLWMKCDVANPEQVAKAIQRTISELKRIDVVINNAGKAGTNPLEPGSRDDLWHKIIDVNLHGTYYVSKAALPHLPRKTGRIINIASVLGLKGVPDQTAYCAAKHAVVGFTRSLSHYLAPQGITVNAICPGWTRTEMAKGRMKEIGLTQKTLESGVPIGRMIEPEEIAKLALYLASDAANGITGQTLTVDGGALA